MSAIDPHIANFQLASKETKQELREAFETMLECSRKSLSDPANVVNAERVNRLMAQLTREHDDAHYQMVMAKREKLPKPESKNPYPTTICVF